MEMRMNIQQQCDLQPRTDRAKDPARTGIAVPVQKQPQGRTNRKKPGGTSFGLSAILCGALFMGLAPKPGNAAVTGATSVDAVVALGARTLEQLDAGRAAIVWAGASPVLRSLIPQDEFARRIQNELPATSVDGDRAWISIARTSISEGAANAPVGNYVSVTFITQDKAGKTRLELVSFREESAGAWALSGYVPKLRPSSP
jgi:hypothetical protein